MTNHTLATLRRLYHHLLHDGRWNHPTDTETLAAAIRTIEELHEGHCRRHCVTSKRQFACGVEWAIGFLPDNWEEAYKDLKEREVCLPTNIRLSEP